MKIRLFCLAVFLMSAMLSASEVHGQCTASIGANITALCNNSASLYITFSGGTSYQWYRNGVQIAGATASSYSATTAGSYYLVTNISGCSGPRTSNTIVITDNTPDVSYSISGNIVQCTPGATLTLTAAASTGITWLKDGAAVGTAQTYVASVSGMYALRVSKSGCTKESSATPLDFYDLNASFTPSARVLCENPITLTASVPGYPLYVWYKDNVQVQSGTSSSYTFTSPGAYKLTVVAKSCSKESSPMSFAQAPVPNLYTASTTPVCAGATATVTLNDSDSGLNYQLYLNGSGLNSVIGGTGQAIQWPGLTTAGNYTVWAVGGCSKQMLGTAAVSFNPLPTVYTLTGGGAMCSGGSGLGFTLSGSQVGINYQLMLNGTATGSPKAGTGSALTWTGQTSAGTYTAVATNTTTQCAQTMTGSPSITVNALPALYTAGGGGAICPSGSGVTITLSGSQTGVSYQLLLNGANNGTPLSGTGSALSWPNRTAAGSYTVQATNNTTTCARTMTGSVTATINPAQYNLTGGGAICSGAPGVPFTLSGSQTGVNYQLQANGTSVGSPLPGTGAALNWSNITGAGTYTVKATNTTTSCFQNMSGSPTVVVNPLPAVFNVSGSGNFCAGTGTIQLSGSVTGTSYQLKINGVATGSSLTGTSSALNWSNLNTPGTYTVTATISATTCNVDMNGSHVAGSPMNTTYTLTGPLSYCAGGTGVTLTLSGSQTGISYQLRKNGVNSVSPLAGTGSAISWNNLLAGTYTVAASNGTTCTLVLNTSAVVTENPLPTLYNVGGGGTICSGATGPNVTLSSSQVGVNYQLKRNTSTNVGAAIAGTGSALTWTNNATAGSYTVVATNATTTCTVTMTGGATVTVNALPTAYTVSGTTTVCDGVAFPVNLSNSQSSTIRYQLRLNGVATGTPQDGKSGALVFTNNLQAGTYTVLATNKTTSCSRVMTGSAVATVVVMALPVIAGPQTIGENSTATLNVSNVVAGNTYQWKKDGSIITGQTGTSLVITSPGNYEVIASSGACSKNSAAYFVAPSTVKYYNGIIAAARWRTDKTSGVDGDIFQGIYAYSYDEKYQLKNAVFGDRWDQATFSSKFRIHDMAYDANGNIQKLQRFNESGLKVHDFAYTYKPNTNQLASINGYSDYQYNALGQMQSEDKTEAGKDQYVEYDVSGKVRKVYKAIDAAGAIPANLKVEFLYDDRGFRQAKVNYETNKTTWYVRDASGNVVSIFEQDGTPIANNTQVTQTEIPVYGAGKMGTYYAQNNGSMSYEITDHLGNVRAVLQEDTKLTEYTATMEDNGLADITNPRVEEGAYFENLFETEANDDFMNHTLPIPGIVDDPKKVAYLYWDDTPGTTYNEKAIGPSIALKVQAGDNIDAEAWVRYERKTSFTQNFDIIALSGLLGNTFAGHGGFDGMTVSAVTGKMQQVLPYLGLPSSGTTGADVFAYLNYIIFDEYQNAVGGGKIPVPAAAGSNTASLYLPGNGPIKISLTQPVKIQTDGYIYLWVSNQSKQARVWFDDFKVTHKEAIPIEVADYGAWGDVIREQKIPNSDYRFGYQGQFAEEDKETGWSHFELREYDPIIGRWTVVDPKRIGFSPYIGMYNNPAIGIDPDGGGPGTEDMEFLYAEAMRQEEYNLHYAIRSSNATLLAEVTISASPYNEWDMFRDLVRFLEPELYANAIVKQAAEGKGGGRVVVPIFGISTSVSKDGFKAEWVSPTSTYLSYRVSPDLEFRYYPAQGEKVPGEDANLRVLATLYRKGPVRAQGDITFRRGEGVLAGGRIVGEWNITKKGTSLELSAGFRVRPTLMMFTLLPPIGQK